MFQRRALLAVRCRIARSGFSSERVFQITLADGSTHIGVSPVEYCLDSQKRRLADDQPGQDQKLSGYIAARALARGRDAEDTIIVSVPSGDVLPIKESDTIKFPEDIVNHVFVQS